MGSVGNGRASRVWKGDHMKKSFIAVFLVLVLLCSVLLTTACTKPPEDYPIPDGLTINIAVFVGSDEFTTIDNAALANAEQEIIHMQTTNSAGTQSDVKYVGYALTAILTAQNKSVPAFTSINAVAADGVTRSMASLDNAYITIGEVKDGEFVEDSSSPRLITDKTSTSSGDIVKQIAKITITPAENQNNGEDECDICGGEECFCPEISVTLNYGLNTMYTITNADFNAEDIKIAEVLASGTPRWYLAFNVADILENANISYGAFISVTAQDSTASGKGIDTYEITSLENSYITLFQVNEDGTHLATPTTSGAPRFIWSAGEATGNKVAAGEATNSNIIQSTVKITLNPVAPEVVISDFSIDIYEGETKVGTLTQDALEGLTHEIISTLQGRQYLAFSLAEALEEAGITLASFTKVEIFDDRPNPTELTISSFENGYITFGFFERDSATITNPNARIIGNLTSTTANNAVINNVEKIVVITA